jgi:hypothetical protein
MRQLHGLRLALLGANQPVADGRFSAPSGEIPVPVLPPRRLPQRVRNVAWRAVRPLALALEEVRETAVWRQGQGLGTGAEPLRPVTATMVA